MVSKNRKTDQVASPEVRCFSFNLRHKYAKNLVLDAKTRVNIYFSTGLLHFFFTSLLIEKETFDSFFKFGRELNNRGVTLFAFTRDRHLVMFLFELEYFPLLNLK